MNISTRVSLALAFLAGSLCSGSSQAPNSAWSGEWGSFVRIPANGGSAAHYEGAGLSVKDCSSQQCHISFEVLGRSFHGEASGDLEFENDYQGVAHLGSSEGEKCSLAFEKPESESPSITVRERTGDCSYFETPGASFEHVYVLRSRNAFYADDIPACFIASGGAAAALCASKELSDQQHDWKALFYEVSDLVAPGTGVDAEQARVLNTCDAATDTAACLANAFSQSADELIARKTAWLASVTEPGGPAAAKQAIDAIAGAYKHSFANGDVEGDKYRSTDTLAIKAVSDVAIQVDVHLEFFNGHECNHQGIASYRRAGFFVEQTNDDQGRLCAFEVIPTMNGVQLADPTGACRLTDCGARGGYNSAAFSSKDRAKAAAIAQTPAAAH